MAQKSTTASAPALALQQKWDICLLTHFFSHPHYGTAIAASIFCREHSVTREAFDALKRTPVLGNYNHKHTDIYGFVARHLKPLYKVACSGDITDCISLALWLKRSAIDASITTDKVDIRYSAAANKATTKKMDARFKLSWALQGQHLDDSSARAWHICK